jgi:hypothetical protein
MNSPNLPNSLDRIRKRFARWRQTHQPRTRFSERLWTEAVAVAREYGHSRTSRILGLDYYSLKKRLVDTPVPQKRNTMNTSSFVELLPPALSECLFEMEDGEGRKMRISLKGGTMADLASLSRSFWRREA